jgi:hypothetical protein
MSPNLPLAGNRGRHSAVRRIDAIEGEINRLSAEQRRAVRGTRLAPLVIPT